VRTFGAGRGFRLGRVARVEVDVDWSLLIIFALIALNLGAGVFPRWHPDWNPAVCWLVGMAAALLFFASVLAHELCHAIVGNAYGVPIRRITLFMFGGLAHMEGQPRSPKGELLMAAAGPLTSIMIGFVATTIGMWLVPADLPADAESAAAFIRHMGPAATLLLWVGPINLVLALFNLVPGFPLDGGRVLRAILWWMTGDRSRATRWAAAVGQMFAWTLIGFGVMTIAGMPMAPFGAGLLQGLWLVLIGWFLLSAATASYRHQILRDALRGLPVSELMRSRFVTITPAMTVRALARTAMSEADQRTFPVVSHGRLVGVVWLDDLSRIPYDAWHQVRVADVMAATVDIEVAAPDDEVADVVDKLGEHDAIPVVDDDQVLGLLRRREIETWVELRG
jgi:Zn-dependent protease/CBS domain-containing protein